MAMLLIHGIVLGSSRRQENIIISSTFVSMTIMQYESDGKVTSLFNMNCWKRRSRSLCQTERFHLSRCHFRETFVGHDNFQKNIPCSQHPEKGSRKTCFSSATTLLYCVPVSRSIHHRQWRAANRNEEGQLSKVDVIGYPLPAIAKKNLADTPMVTTRFLPTLTGDHRYFNSRWSKKRNFLFHPLKKTFLRILIRYPSWNSTHI